MNELKNCPFTMCNGEAVITPEGDYYEAHCIECGCFVQAHTYEECLNLWNTRTASPRFTAAEREALDFILDSLETPFNVNPYTNKHIDTVRKMLEVEIKKGGEQ